MNNATSAADRIPPCPISGYRFAPFASWYGVRHAAEHAVGLYYHAPLDHGPYRVIVLKAFKNGKLRLSAAQGVTFTADPRHLDRFYWLESEAT